MAPMTRNEEILATILARLDRIERERVLDLRSGELDFTDDERAELVAIRAAFAGGAQ